MHNSKHIRYIVLLFLTFILVYINWYIPVNIQVDEFKQYDKTNEIRITLEVRNKSFIPVKFSGFIWSNVQGEGCAQIKSAYLDKASFFEGLKLQPRETESIFITIQINNENCNLNKLNLEYSWLTKLNRFISVDI